MSEGSETWFLVDDGAVLYRLRAVRVGPEHGEGTPLTLQVVGA